MIDSSSAASSAEKTHDSIELTNFFFNDIDSKTIDVKTIRKYVRYHFRKYVINDLENYSLWDLIQENFEHFKKKHFVKLDRDDWELVKIYCYTHDVWIDHNYELDRTHLSPVIKIINTKWEMNWTFEQIKWVQKRYKHLFDKTLIRKRELMSIIESDNLDIVTAVNSRDLTANSRTSYQNIRLQISVD